MFYRDTLRPSLQRSENQKRGVEVQQAAMLLRCHSTGPGAIQLDLSPDELVVLLLKRCEGAEWARGNPPQALTLAKKVVIVPGYGLAVAGAQATVADLVSTLRANGVSVKFAIHPVVGAPPRPSSSFSILPPARTPAAIWRPPALQKLSLQVADDPSAVIRQLVQGTRVSNLCSGHHSTVANPLQISAAGVEATFAVFRTPLWPHRDDSDIPCMSACRACAARAAAGTSPGVLQGICFHPGSHMSDAPSPLPSAGQKGEG